MSTKRRHIAVLTLINAGHVYPTLGLCSELVARGHRVTYLTNDRFAERVTQSGAEPVPVRTPELTNADKIQQFPSTEDPRFWRLYASIICPYFITLAAAMVRDTEAFYSKNVPDLIIYDRFAFAGRILAQQLGSRAINVWSHFAYRDLFIRENGVCVNPEPFVAFSRVLDAFMSAYGVEAKGSIWYTEKLGIYFVPREFQHEIDSFDDSFCFSGPCMNRPRPVAWRSQSKGKPVVLVTESQVTVDKNFLSTCIDAFAGSEYHVVLSRSDHSSEISADELPANIELNRTAYNTDILPHVALIVCQAGMGTVLESLYNGVPIIAVPPTPFHSEVAYRVEELGLGKAIAESRMTATAIRACADDILRDADLLDRVKAMQTAIRRTGGAKLAADRIERFLES